MTAEVLQARAEISSLNLFAAELFDFSSRFLNIFLAELHERKVLLKVFQFTINAGIFHLERLSELELDFGLLDQDLANDLLEVRINLLTDLHLALL